MEAAPRLTADHRQRRAQLVRRVGDELALALEGVRQAVEHVVEGFGQDQELTARARRWVHPRSEVAPVDPRGDVRQAAHRRRYPGRDQVRRRDRQQQYDAAAQQERAGDPCLGLADRRQWLGSARIRHSAGGHKPLLVKAQRPDVGGLAGFVADTGNREQPPHAPLERLFSGALAVGSGPAEQLRMVARRSHPGHEQKQQRRSPAEWLRGDIAARRRHQLPRRGIRWQRRHGPAGLALPRMSWSSSARRRLPASL